MQRYTVGLKDTGLRLDKWLLRRSKLPWALVNKLLRKNKISVVSKESLVTSSSYKLQTDDQIWFPESIKLFSGYMEDSKLVEDFKAWILHEDENFIVINKPPGIPSQGGTYVKVSIDCLARLYHQGARLMHRLDKEVSGTMALGKHSSAASTSISNKVYLGIVQGLPFPQSGVVNSCVNKEATTKYTTIKTNKVDGNWVSYMKYELVTGRKHQIRIHTSRDLECPLIGDFKYGFDFEGDWKYICLHSQSLEVGSQKFTASLPEHFQNTLLRFKLE